MSMREINGCSGRVYPAVEAGAQEEARPRDQTATQELKAEGDPHKGR